MVYQIAPHWFQDSKCESAVMDPDRFCPGDEGVVLKLVG
jgi:hypothetical protein